MAGSIRLPRAEPPSVDWPSVLLCVAALAVVPLGLGSYPEVRGRWLVFPAAACLVLAHLVPRGPLAAGLCAPWLLFAFSMAAQARRLKHAALVFLAVGAVWAMASRANYPLMGFSPIIVQMTGLHFHYAGFALSVLAWRTGSRLALAGVVLGMPLVAAGITFSPRLEWLGAWFMALAACFVAVQQLRLPGPWPARALWSLSSLSLFGGMGLAVVYAWQEYHGRGDLAPMLQWHSSFNALGFALMGLLGWVCSESVQTGKVD